MKNFFLLLLIFISISWRGSEALSNLSQYESKNSLSISIQNVLEEYSKNKPIDIHVSIKNLSNETILLNNRCSVGVEVLFEITKSSGVKIRPKKIVYLGSPSKDNLIELSKGKTFEFMVDITQFYELDENGQYNVKAIYNPYNGDLKDVWSEEIESNIVNFLVTE